MNNLRLQLLSLFALTELTSGQLHSSTNPPVDPSSAPSKTLQTMHQLIMLLIHIVQILIEDKSLIRSFYIPSVYGGAAGYCPQVQFVV